MLFDLLFGNAPRRRRSALQSRSAGPQPARHRAGFALRLRHRQRRCRLLRRCVGLVRAFRTAGAKNVLMALTPVGDKFSREFMETFYDNWLSSEDNISPSQALHKTRLDFIHHKDPAFRDPAVWSPYVLVER